ncbi:hypothetical protein B5K05_23490 [Rhizobium phaseoli]|uniref:hypothetical protein n=1 Tax=Rhizobium phaseoli TaxID=396 RepID=UPI000379BAA0|nr:hypothetical protein [Rhizobium phaseoli]KKZ84086.1 hypothetical protein RPHASCH2410_PD04065 [Rhizobium phaseoli Ch24-10]RDJ05016.1 hypothetical protein B5K04_23425 [Rhizobium phaseoli]RDJ07259.1 hypothetical protein B5K05_23490 [Rhizobium phaseoli]
MAVFGKLISEFDGSSDLAQAEREALETLEALGETKRELFTKQINLLILDAGHGTNKTVPISKVLRTDGMSRAFSSHNMKDIPEVIKTAVGGFIEGGTNNIIDGVFSLLSKALEVFLGSTEGQSMTTSKYFVYATDFAIYRVDLMAWSRSVTAASLKTKIEQATAFSYVLSNVDVAKISWSDFVGIFALQLDEISTLTKEERDEARQRMKETWDFLTGGAASAATLEDLAVTRAHIETEYRLPLISYN